MRLRVLLVLTLAAVGLAAPATAGADDASVRAAGDSRDAQFSRLGKQIRRAYRAWDASGFRSLRLAHRIIRLNRRTRATLDAVDAALHAEQPSSPAGASYKRLLLASTSNLDVGFRWDSRAVRRHLRGRERAARAAWRRAARHFNRAIRLGDRARKIFPPAPGNTRV